MCINPNKGILSLYNHLLKMNFYELPSQHREKTDVHVTY